MKYARGESFNVGISGHYVNWNLGDAYESNLDDIILDLNSTKRINVFDNDIELFLNIQNFLNGSQYFFGGDKNPARRIEGGIRITF